MTDLTQALAELRRGPHWPGTIPWKDVQNMVCNAALSGDLIPVQCCMCGKTGLSIREGDGGPECQLDDGRWTCSRECWDRATGDLIPRADADLAVALMVEKAADSLQTLVCGHGTNASPAYDAAWAAGATFRAECDFEAIRDLVPASALAELQALRDERDAYKAASRAAHTDITTYLRIVADMTKEAEAAEAELATLRAQVERLTRALKAANDYLDKGLPERAFNVTRTTLTEGAAPS